jgi:hypothetical protein
MPLRYPATVRRQIAQRLRSGEPVVAIAAETSIRQSTLLRVGGRLAGTRARARSNPVASQRDHARSYTSVHMTTRKHRPAVTNPRISE